MLTIEPYRLSYTFKLKVRRLSAFITFIGRDEACFTCLFVRS